MLDRTVSLLSLILSYQYHKQQGKGKLVYWSAYESNHLLLLRVTSFVHSVAPPSADSIPRLPACRLCVVCCLLAARAPFRRWTRWWRSCGE